MKLNTLKNKRGALLIHILVMAAVLALLGVMLLKLTLSRHTNVRKLNGSISAKAAVEACMAKKTAEWNGSAPASGSCDINGVTVTVTVSGNQVQYSVENE